MGVARTGLAAVIASAVCAACGLVTQAGDLEQVTCVPGGCDAAEATTPTDGASSDAAADAEAGARRDASDAAGDALATHDADADADLANDADAAPPADATNGDGAPVGDSSVGWCASQGPHLFCADFDEGSLLLGWTGTDLSPTGSVTLDTAAYTSPPGSFLVSLPGSSSAMFARLRKDIGASGSSFVIAFDTRVDVGADPKVMMLSVHLGQTHVQIRLTPPASAELDEAFYPGDGGSTLYLHKYPFTLPASTWQRVQVDVRTTAQQADVRVNGALVLTNVTLSSSFTGAQPDIYLGAYIGSGGVWSIHYDDVTFDQTP